jgi:putative membrane protein
MGVADLIPGISGGTIAFIMGFYTPLLEGLKTFNLEAIRLLLTGRWRDFNEQVAWRFILTLITGIGCSIICFASLFHHILQDPSYRVFLYAFFMGLIFASLVFCMRQIRQWEWKNIAGLILGGLITFFMTESSLKQSADGGPYAIQVEIEAAKQSFKNYDHHTHLLTGITQQSLGVLLSQGIIDEDSPVYNLQKHLIGIAGEFALPNSFSFFNSWLIFCGALAVCALLLPGISGSYILTFMGVYPLVMEALVDFIHHLKAGVFYFEGFAILSSLGIGILIGAVAFSRTVTRLLHSYPEMTLSILSGFMIGAVRSVWPFWAYEYTLMPLKLHKGAQLIPLHPLMPAWNSPETWQACLCAISGIVLFFALESLSAHKKRTRSTG